MDDLSNGASARLYSVECGNGTRGQFLVHCPMFPHRVIEEFHLIVEDVLSPIATTHDRVDCTGSIAMGYSIRRYADVYVARHRPDLHSFRTAVKSLLSSDSYFG